MPRQGRPFYDPGQNQWRLRHKTVVVGLDGKPRIKTHHHLCSGKRNYAKALREAGRIMGGPAAGADPLQTQTVAELVEAWIAQYGNDWYHDQLCTWCEWEISGGSKGGTPPSPAGMLALDALPADHLDAYHAYLKTAKSGRGKPHSLRTIRAKLGAASRVLRWANKIGALNRVIEKPRASKDRPRPRDYPPDVLVRLFADAKQWATYFPNKTHPDGPPVGPLPERARAALAFMLETGARPGEVCRLKWAELERRRGQASKRQHKTRASTGDDRRIQLTPRATAIIDQIPHDDEYVFVNRKGKPYKPSGLRSIIRLRAEALGCDVTTLYALRHTFAQSMLDQGYRLEDVGAWLGHRNLSTTHGYAQVRQDRLREIAKEIKSPLRRA